MALAVMRGYITVNCCIATLNITSLLVSGDHVKFLNGELQIMKIYKIKFRIAIISTRQ